MVLQKLAAAGQSQSAVGEEWSQFLFYTGARCKK